jgi:hypothetical protein
MFKVIDEEQVNGFTMGWAEGLDASARSAVRRYMQRYPDLIPDGTVTVVATHDIYDRSEGRAVWCDPVEDCPDTTILVIGQRWRDATTIAREELFVAERLAAQLVAGGLIIKVADDDFELRPTGRIVKGRDIHAYIRTLTEAVIMNRARFGGTEAPCTLAALG